MRLEDDKTQVQVLFVQDKIKADEKNENIQQGVRSAAGGIAKSLQGHDPAERGIKKIYKRNDPFFRHG